MHSQSTGGGGAVGLAELSLEDKKDTWAQFVFLSFKKKKKPSRRIYTRMLMDYLEEYRFWFLSSLYCWSFPIFQ